MKIRIEYCSAWNYEPRAVGLTDKVLRKFKQKVESLSLSPFADGRFEVFVDGKQVWFKLATGEFPTDEAMLEAIAAA